MVNTVHMLPMYYVLYRTNVATITSIVVDVFVGFEPCPSCGSRDNLSRWADGHGWCFGCKRYEPPTVKFRLSQNVEKVNPSQLRPLPEDTSKSLGAKGLIWLKKYGIMNSELENFRWSDERQWLIYLIDEGAWQARNFSDSGPKYYTAGKIQDILHIIGTDINSIILVEDAVSAIKVGRHASAMPIFGSNIALKTLVRLSTRFPNLGIWLDKDKAVESLKSKHRASQLGFDNVRTIITEKDPKDYNDEEICEFLRK